ncbi:methyltransferase domain-containing protein [Natronomonas salina]|uniref:class I SAM-dependent methyltransferase n=1 Tax=Natronomonas salina TaxID=1710540 RepID=UPI0015B39C3D|nr:methyltransferase domain-containing protein [Natronomonas salina]QLD90193.1 methyltransferase domain-containing protein [Natronomonas salina]
MADVADFYGRWAGLYDRIATAPGVARWRRAAAERVAGPGDTVVEMGCGSGANLPFLRERVGPAGRVVGVDVTRPLLARARARTREFDNVAVVEGDATRPPVESADAVLATFLCGLLEDPGGAVDDWCDLVGSGGRVALLDATATGEAAGRPLNPLFRAFVAAGSPGAGPVDVLRAPFGSDDDSLTRRVDASREALADRAVERRHETFALGLVGLLSGRVR